MVIKLVTLVHDLSHQLKSFILSPATTHFPLKKYRRSVIIFKNASELRRWEIYLLTDAAQTLEQAFPQEWVFGSHACTQI